jgi:hypothetical protein
MKNLRLSFVLLLFCLSAVAQENPVQVNSKITNVTVFMNGAQVQRQAEAVEIPQGVHTFVFAGLSSSIESQSIQAKGEGSFTILSVAQQGNFLFEKKNDDLKNNYLNTIATLNDQMTALRNENDVYRADEEMLLKNNSVMGPNVNYDLTKLKQALDFQKQRLTEAKSKQVEINKQLAKLQVQLQKYQQQLVELNGKSPANTNDIVVKISAKATTKGKLSLTYMVNNASWYPTYDIRAKDISSPITLGYKANVSQNSGEDWRNIKLTLSSGNPTNNNSKPELSPYHLGFLSAGYSLNNSSSAAIRTVKGKVADETDRSGLPGVSIRIKNTSIATITDANGNFTLQLPVGTNLLTFSYIGYETKEIPVENANLTVYLTPSQNSLNEVVVTSYTGSALMGRASGLAVRASSRDKEKKTEAVMVNTLQQQTNVAFEIANPYTILSDGKQFAVEIGNYDFDATYAYFSAPKVSEEAFLTAKLTGFDEVNLLPGEANIFFEGTFLGKSLIDIQNVADTLTISLGVDQNVVVKREKQKDFSKQQLIGNTQRETRGFVIDVKNRKSQTVRLTIADQLPISTNSDISVEVQDIANAVHDEATGKLIWNLVLKPNENKKLNLKYQVKYPKNKPVNLE